MAATLQSAGFSPDHKANEFGFLTDVANFYWFIEATPFNQYDPIGEHPGRDTIIFGRESESSFGPKSGTSIDTLALPGEAPRTYVRRAMGLEGGAVSMLDGYTAPYLPHGKTWADVKPKMPKADDSEYLAQRVFGLKSFQFAASALKNLRGLPDQVANPSVEYKFAWCVLTSYLVQKCWIALNTFPEWQRDVMRIYLAGGPDMDDASLRKLIGTPWPLGKRGPFGGVQFDDAPRQSRWPTVSSKINWSNFEYVLAREAGAPTPSPYGLNKAMLAGAAPTSRDTERDGYSYDINFEGLPGMGRFGSRYDKMRKRALFMPYSAWNGTAFSAGPFQADLAKADTVNDKHRALIYMWSFFGAPSNSYFTRLSEYQNSAWGNTVVGKRGGGWAYGLDYYYKYALPMWAEFFSNADFGALVQCNHAAWQFAQTNAGRGHQQNGAFNEFSEQKGKCLPCGGDGAQAPLDDYAQCSMSYTISSYNETDKTYRTNKRLTARLFAINLTMKIVKMFYQAYSGNMVGFAFTTKDYLQMVKRGDGSDKNTPFFESARAVPPPFLRSVSQRVNSRPGSKVHPTLNDELNPSIRFSTDPFKPWTWAALTAAGGTNTPELNDLKSYAETKSDLDKIPQEVLFPAQVDNALKNFSKLLGTQLNFVLRGSKEALQKATAREAPPAIVRTVKSPALLLEPAHKSLLPLVATGILTGAAAIIMFRRRGQ